MLTANKKLKNAPGIRSKGFTLIELLIVIAVIGILAAALLVAIDPIDKVNAGNDTKVITNVRAIGDAALRYYTNNSALPTQAQILSSGELKTWPTAPNTYATYAFYSNGLDDVSACGQVKSKANRKKAAPAAATIPANAYVFVSGGSLCYTTTACTGAYMSTATAGTTCY